MNTSILPYIELLSSLVILHSLHMDKTSENAFINPFLNPFHHSAKLPYPCIWDFIHSPDILQTSEVVHLYSPNPLSSSLIIILLPYIRTDTSNDSFKTPAHSSYKPLTLARVLIAPGTLFPLATFLQHSASSVPDSLKTYLKYLNSETCSNRIPSMQTSHSKTSLSLCSYLH